MKTSSPRSSTRRTPGTACAVLMALAVIAVGVLVYVPACGNDDSPPAITTPTSLAVGTSTTGAAPATNDSARPGSSSSSATAVGGPPGDSAGAWVEIELPGVLTNVQGAALSEKALVVAVGGETDSKIFAYDLESGALLELPVDAVECGGPDIDGALVVWWEGTFDQETGALSESHIYSFLLPNGPKIEIAGTDRNPGYPQVSGGRVTWIQSSPHEANDEEWRVPIHGVRVDEFGRPAGMIEQLVPTATAYYLGDSTWNYGLSPGLLAWEQASADGGFDAGTHLLDLDTRTSLWLGESAWRPSLAGDLLAFWSDGVKVFDVTSRSTTTVDTAGDFPACAPTYVAYFRPSPGDAAVYQAVVRGYEGRKEQVLGNLAGPPWLSLPLAVSATGIVFAADYHSVPRLFEWRSN